MIMRCVIFLCLLGAQLITHVVTLSIDEIIASSAETACQPYITSPSLADNKVKVTLNINESSSEMVIVQFDSLACVYQLYTGIDKANEFAFFQSTEEGALSVKVELDMLFTAQQWKEIQRLNKTGRGGNGRYKRKAIRLDEYRWHEGVILYKIADNVFTEEEKAEIQRALDEWQAFTCITFKRASTSDVNYVLFDNGSGCFSYVGMTGGPQKLGLAKGCRVKGVIVHEVGHAVGFQHEQTRPDRDDYVEIIQGNIPPNLYYNFQKYEKEVVNVFDVPYDYESVMHYGPKAFSVTGGETIRTKDPMYQSVIGNRKGLSFRDIKLANLMYGCSRRVDCRDLKCPGEGFLDKNCKCMCPGNPVRECYGTTLGSGSGTRTEASTRAEKGSTIQSVTGGCTDLYPSCPKWAERGDCENYPLQMKAYCKKSCNLCYSEVTENCKDMSKHCGYWRDKGYCEKEYITYMHSNCAKTCQVCQADDPKRDVSKEEKSSAAPNIIPWLTHVAACILLTRVK